MSAGQFYFTKEHYDHVECLHRLLDKAVTDIVERWYDDEEASFPARMPLRDNEEKLLRWMYGPGRKSIPPYKGRQGNWRPDYLLEKCILPHGAVTENPRICEINGRFPWNGFAATAHIAEVIERLAVAKGRMKPGMPSALKGLDELFDASKPLHLVNDKFPVRDPLEVAEIYKQTTGQQARFIRPSDLQWLPDTASDGNYHVFCPTPDGRGVERVYQVDFELEQEEFELVDLEILCQLAPTCINDLRTDFFVNDQRFLGVVYGELGDLVLRGTLTQQEADILRQGLVPSFLPTSLTWAKVIEESKTDSSLKDQWVLKNARSGLSQGHLFGKVTDSAEWLERLTSAKESNCKPDSGSYVLQRYVEQMGYDSWSHHTNGVLRTHLVSSYFATNGKFLGIGGARTADLVVMSMIKGEGYLLNVVTAA